MIAGGAEPVTLGNDHEGGSETGEMPARVTRVTQQNGLRPVTLTCRENLSIDKLSSIPSQIEIGSLSWSSSGSELTTEKKPALC